MKIFLLRLMQFSIVAFLVICFLGTELSEPEEFNYVGAIVAKHNRLESLTGRRIILAGGSNLAFGIDSKRIEDEIKIPVVNLGLHAGLGLDFILNELKSVVTEGDIVFLSPEYYAGKGRYNLQMASAGYFPPANSYFERNLLYDLKHFFDRKFDNMKVNKTFLVTQLMSKVLGRQPSKSVYANTSFNTYGDVVAHLKMKAPPSLNDRNRLAYDYWDGIEKINEASEKIMLNGADIFFLYPCYAQSAYTLNRETLSDLDVDLRRDLRIPILNSPHQLVYPDSLFFDTVYHLNKTGRDLRTTKLLKTIKELLLAESI
ncbi:hypothetical protein [Chitinophaga sp. XS-30]|uniref:hypothetical protein n=1 Tax=Chitinophaga sp. XS-30 TaxID=2604421 RepID=UPI0011DD49A8|nr:hypothetical protein [Chitinophaga sp. XS-30]QEH39768.1 hypothetical protein FW415_02365 [Chitinophaga sp. XS-30]